MRPIKFRAWDDLHNKMYPVSDIEWDADGRMWVTADDGKNGIELIDDEAHLMQFTGLKDNNGREIYEGDIVQVTSEDGEFYVAAVKWFGDEGYPAFDLAEYQQHGAVSQMHSQPFLEVVLRHAKLLVTCTRTRNYWR